MLLKQYVWCLLFYRDVSVDLHSACMHSGEHNLLGGALFRLTKSTAPCSRLPPTVVFATEDDTHKCKRLRSA